MKNRPPAAWQGALCCVGLFVLVGLFVGGGQVVGLGVELADDAGGDAGDDGVGGHVCRDDRPGPHDVTPGTMVTLEPIQTFLPVTMGAG